MTDMTDMTDDEIEVLEAIRARGWRSLPLALRMQSHIVAFAEELAGVSFCDECEEEVDDCVCDKCPLCDETLALCDCDPCSDCGESLAQCECEASTEGER